MDTNEYIRTRGIVLSEEKYKESSKIINLFTEKNGRINIFASGVLRPKSGLMMVSEKFVESDFLLTRSKNNFYIKSGEVINSNIELANNLHKYFIADMICELLIKTMPENLVEEKIYNLTSQVFSYLKDDMVNPQILKMGYLLKLISFLGFRPQLQQCVECSSKDYSNMYFSHRDGGIICGNCLDIDGEYVKLSKVEIEIILKMLYSKFSDYEQMDIPENIIGRVDNLVYDYILYCTDITELVSQNKYKKLMEI
ncbi:MAG: DNA repair protein RecO [Tissierellia bacterium]|nr:DNA repair protein RecO [Tissierellia bacterium]